MTARKWDGMAPCGIHGADFEGQSCNICPKPRPGRKPRAGVAATRQVHVRLTEEAFQLIMKACRPGETATDVLRDGGLALAARRAARPRRA